MLYSVIFKKIWGAQMLGSKLYIEGGKSLSGTVSVHGAKNSSLPILAATLMCHGTSTIHNCPALSDVYSALRILSSLGCKCKREGNSVTVNASDASGYEVSETLMREMRSSIIFLGAILSRLGRCRLSFPGGCELGPRPIDIHLHALKKLGVKIIEDHGVLDCTLSSRPVGTDITLPLPSVGATENIMLLASTCLGTTVIRNAAKEPEISDLASFLNSAGAEVSGAGSTTVYIKGADRLHSCEHSVMPDRIVAATYMGAAAITGGEVMIEHVTPSDMYSTMAVFEQMGCGVYPYADRIFITAKKPLRAVKTIRTTFYPGFPTDCQPIVMAALCKAKGTSMIVENIFENRFRAAGELLRMGADIKAEGKVAVIEGVASLSGASVVAHDLRAGAALVLAGLAAEGTTTVSGVNYIDRGYERIEHELSGLGAKIKRM